MGLIAMREAIVAKIGTELPELRVVEPHGGRFDLQELRRVSTLSPGAFVACLQVADADDSTGDASGDVLWAVFVTVSASRRDAPRDLVAMALAQGILALLPGQRWGREDAETIPRQIRADNLFSSEIDKHGVAMWAVSWRQRCVLKPGEASDLPDFLLACVTTTPAGAEHGAPRLETNVTLEGAS